MIDKDGQTRVMVQYLFGELSAEEREKFEDAYLNDSEIFQELVTLENEMVDRYVLNDLSGAERERFERSLLSNPARCEMVKTARSLLVYAAAAENAMLPQAPHFRGEAWYAPVNIRARGAQVAAAAVFLLMIGAISWLALSNRRLENEVGKLRREQSAAAQDRAVIPAMQKQIEKLRADLQQREKEIQQIAQLTPQDTATVSFTLDAALSRGLEDMPSLVIPGHVRYVSLRLVLGRDSHSHYSVSLRTPDDRLLWNRNNIRGRFTPDNDKEVVLTLPSRLLQNGDYVVRVNSGAEDPQNNLAGYSFRVIRR